VVRRTGRDAVRPRLQDLQWILALVRLEHPAGTTSLPEGAGTPGNPGLPAPSVLGRTDFGMTGYGGACPPPGDTAHRYVFTVAALDTADIQVPPDLPMAAVNVVMQEHALAAGYRTVLTGL
jgi:Raf kinase inhibitor-like YbhB/YbcL family protein